MKKIGVIGATGMVGAPVTRQLAAAGFEITVLARNITSASAKFPTLKVVPADLQDRAGLVAALRGLDVLYVSLAVDPAEKPDSFHPESDGIKALADAAREAEVGRIVLLSSLIQFHPTSSWWVLDIKREAVRIVKASGIPHTIFYCSNFMENFPNRNLRGSNLGLVGKSQYPSWWIAADDYGRQVVQHLVSEPSGNHEFVVQGPEALDAETAARSFIAHYQPAKLKFSYAPKPVLSLMSIFVRPIKYVLAISDVINTYPETFQADETWRQLGKPTTTIASYADSLS